MHSLKRPSPNLKDVAYCMPPSDSPCVRTILFCAVLGAVLLRYQHPWIASSVKAIQEHGGEEGSSVIRDLVAEHLPALEAFRQVRWHILLTLVFLNLVREINHEGWKLEGICR